MIRYFLKQVEIEGFRGINNEDNPLIVKFKSDSINSIFAPNAQGKSSIYEAICYAIKGNIPKLETLHSSDRSEEYYCNRFNSSGNAKILITFTPDDGSRVVEILITRDKYGNRKVESPSGYNMPEKLLENLNNELCLIDQKTFNKFVEDSPLHRGRTFSSLLGLGILSQYRQALEVLANTRSLNSDFSIDQLQSEIGIKKTSLDRSIQNIEIPFNKITNLNVSIPFNIEFIVNNTTSVLKDVNLLEQFFQEKDILSVNYDSIKKIIRDAEDSDMHNQLSEVIKKITELSSLASQEYDEQHQNDLKVLVEVRDNALKATQGSLFKALYETLLKIFQSDEWTYPKRCPACNSDLDYDFESEVGKQLKEYEEVASTTTKIIEFWNSNVWINRMKDLFQSKNLQFDNKQKEVFQNIENHFRSGDLSESDLKLFFMLFLEVEAVLKKKLDVLEKEKGNIEKELPPSLVNLTEKITYAEQIKDNINKYLESQSEINTLKNSLNTRLEWQKFIVYACNSFAEAEVKLSTQKTLDLEKKYQMMYSKITNNMDIVPKLKKSEGTQDLYLTLENFYGLKDVAATTLLAESYKNALAISIYLSSVLDNILPANFIVLDDVTSSFDAGCQFNLMELLKTKIARPINPNGPQIIIFSHDGLLQKYFDKISNESQWFHQTIQGLPPMGSIFTQAQDSCRLRSIAENFLNVGKIQQAEPLIRQYLEFKLLEIIKKVGIKVPIDFSIRDDKKMVQNCLDAIKESIELEKKAGTLTLEPSQVNALENTLIPTLISNWVSHYSTGVISSFSPYVLLGVLDYIDSIADCFKYDCHCLPNSQTVRRYYKTLSSKHCNC
ncbi:MAG TPA: AAA family ATPase [Atribacterota bacterium]|nr:AAA family ATPase [Atribacterota bacterium]